MVPGKVSLTETGSRDVTQPALQRLGITTRMRLLVRPSHTTTGDKDPRMSASGDDTDETAVAVDDGHRVNPLLTHGDVPEVGARQTRQSSSTGPCPMRVRRSASGPSATPRVAGARAVQRPFATTTRVPDAGMSGPEPRAGVGVTVQTGAVMTSYAVAGWSIDRGPVVGSITSSSGANSVGRRRPTRSKVRHHGLVGDEGLLQLDQLPLLVRFSSVDASAPRARATWLVVSRLHPVTP